MKFKDNFLLESLGLLILSYDLSCLDSFPLFIKKGSDCILNYL